MTVQYIITGGIVLVCIGMAAYRIYRKFTSRDEACRGCQLKDTCSKHSSQDTQGYNNCTDKQLLQHKHPKT